MRTFMTDENQVEKIEGMTVEFPYCMHRRDLTDLVIPWHWHAELELGYMERGKYLMNYRLIRAKELLVRSDLSITEISGRCGFTDGAYMGRQFRKACGMPPKEYRQRNRSQ